jgi:hypothetical protein
MFNYCIWYTLVHDHRLNVLIRTLAQHLRTDFYHGHITVHSRLEKQEANNTYAMLCKITKPWYKLHGTIYQTETIDTGLYALQQDYYMYDVERLGKHHVSLAYRIGNPFTEEEIAYANSLIPVDHIWNSDIYISLNDCRSVLPKHWNQIKRHIF